MLSCMHIINLTIIRIYYCHYYFHNHLVAVTVDFSSLVPDAKTKIESVIAMTFLGLFFALFATVAGGAKDSKKPAWVILSVLAGWSIIFL